MSQSIQIEVVGPLTREQLRPTNNLKAVFRSMRSYLAANAVGMTRDQVHHLSCQRSGCRDEITEAVRTAIGLRREASELSWQAVQLVAPPAQE